MLSRLIRIAFVAAAATMALVAANQAHAEGDASGAVLRSSETEVQAAQSQDEAPAKATSTPVAVPAPVASKEANKLSNQALGYAAMPEASVEKRSPIERIIGHNREGAQALRPLIEKYATAEGVPFDIANAVVRIESRYNSKARNGPNLGLTQISLPTARSLGYSGDASGLFEAETNLRFGIKYLGMAYKMAGGDVCGTILRYQAGHRAVSMTGAARTYCSKVKMLLAEAS